MTRAIVVLAVLVAGVLAGPATPAAAQTAPVYIPLGEADGVLYRPDHGPAPHVGVLVAHRTANFLHHAACTELSARGFLVLCMNTRYQGNEELVRFETMMLDVKAGVEALRRQPGITKVLLFAHSGGGPTMSFYEAVAENGVGYCNRPERLVRCGDELARLPRADGIVYADAHPGNPVNVLRGINPSVGESDPPDGKVDPALDPFSPANGFNPAGPSHYSEAFQQRYYAAQSARMNRLLARAQSALDAMRGGTYGYPDDDILVIPRGGNPGAGPGAAAGLFLFDPSIRGIMETARPEKLLRDDGTVTTRVVHSVYVAQPRLRARHLTFDGGTKILSIRSFLSANATRSTNSLDGIDDCSSNNSTLCAVRAIAVPEMFAAMGAHYFIRDVEREYDAAASRDKDYIVVEGATHFFTPCAPCETQPGQYAHTTKNFFDYVARWIGARY